MHVSSHATHVPCAERPHLHMPHPRSVADARPRTQTRLRLILAGPSFYHEHAFPSWFLLQRSAIVREALDVVQEMAFYKVAQKNATQRLPRSNIVTRVHLARLDMGRRASVHPSTALTYLYLNPMQGASHKILQPSTHNTRRIS
jgi:hypothetical protein